MRSKSGLVRRAGGWVAKTGSQRKWWTHGAQLCHNENGSTARVLGKTPAGAEARAAQPPPGMDRSDNSD